MILLAAMLLAGGAPWPVQAGGMPQLFDKRERLQRPDLSTLLRLRFLTSTDFPPFNFADQTGRLSGFHVDLVREICSELEIEAKCQVQAMPFSDLRSALEQGQGEAIVAGVAPTEELRRRFAFSRPFMMLPARFAVSRQGKFDTTDARALAGKRVGVVGATAHESMLGAFFPDIKPVPFTDRAALTEAMKRKEVDAVFADALQLSFWVNSPAAEACCRLFDGPYFSERFLGEGLTIMLSKSDPRLVDAVDNALAALARKGKLQQIYMRYFPYDLFGAAMGEIAPGAQALR